MGKITSMLSIIFVLYLSFFTVDAKKCEDCVNYAWQNIEQKGDIPFDMWDGASAYNEKDELFYIFGGLNGSYPVDFPVDYFHAFDTSKSKWKNLGTSYMPSPRAEAMMWVDPITENVYVSGGRGPFRRGNINISHNTTFMYNAKHKYWAEIIQTTAQQHLSNRSTEALVVGNKVYAFSGSSSTTSAFITYPETLKTDLIVFEPSVGWSLVNTFGTPPTPRAHHHLIYNEDLDSIFVYGGYTRNPDANTSFDDKNYLGDFWQFKLKTKTWVNLTNPDASLPNPGKRDNCKIIYADKTELFVIGGSYIMNNLMDVWRYEFATQTWSEVIVLPPVNANTKVQLPIPLTIGSFYHRAESKCSREIRFFSGSLGETHSALIPDMYLLSIPVAK